MKDFPEMEPDLREKLLKAYHTDPIVHSYLALYVYGNMSWNDAVVSCIVSLVDVKNTYEKTLAESNLTIPPRNPY